MLAWIRSHWQNALRGFWLFPGLTALALAVLAVVLVELDRRGGAEGISHTFDGDASAARSILTTVGATVITVAGLAFSITVVTVQLVSSQFSPRTLRSFLADRPSQLIAGAFVGIFAYCLLVLRTVRDEGGRTAEFVPSLSVSVAIGLGLVGLVLLLVFIHRVTQVIKVENITGRVAAETLDAIESHYPDPFAEAGGPELAEVLAAWEASGPPRAVHPAQPGHVRAVEAGLLPKLDLPAGSRIHLAARAGDQVTTSTAVVRVWCTEPLDEGLLDDLRRLVTVERERDVAADPAFGIRQLTDVALRALSPGVNDPTTAITCIGYLQEALEQLAGRRFPDPVRRLEPGGILVAASTASFEELVREPFADLARFASGDARVVSALLDALAGIASAAGAAGAGRRVAAVLESAEEVAAPAFEDARTASDRGLVAAGLARVRESAGYSTMQGPDGTRRSGPAAASSTSSTGTA
ncbi:MAG TPA: DUF2254 domain-containing protein [Gaiellaceae bacterium]|nr:DUF2254 domain-containing protein [Gaiellaceae bacterium]